MLLFLFLCVVYLCIVISVFLVVLCQVFFVGWVERSETQHDRHNQYLSGFASLYPTYKIGIDRAVEYLINSEGLFTILMFLNIVYSVKFLMENCLLVKEVKL